MTRAFIAALFVTVSLSSAVEAKKRPMLTPMELQALQSKEFETTKESLFASVVSVFQDLGYQIENADLPTGFINATSAAGNKTNVWEAMSGMRSSGNTRATAFVEKMPNGLARVRLNFLSTKMTTFGYGQQTRDDRPILDLIVYRTAWDKIDEALFVRQASEASPSPSSSPIATPAAIPQ
jgi:hypothetical protein